MGRGVLRPVPGPCGGLGGGDYTTGNASLDDPRKLEYAGQRTAAEVFSELKHRLEGMGYLPDEYFLLRDEWQNGREIPRDADLFCTVDYGASEGVYVDVYLKWYDEKQSKSITESFITGTMPISEIA